MYPTGCTVLILTILQLSGIQQISVEIADQFLPDTSLCTLQVPNQRVAVLFCFPNPKPSLLQIPYQSNADLCFFCGYHFCNL